MSLGRNFRLFGMVARGVKVDGSPGELQPLPPHLCCVVLLEIHHVFRLA